MAECGSAQGGAEGGWDGQWAPPTTPSLTTPPHFAGPHPTLTASQHSVSSHSILLSSYASVLAVLTPAFSCSTMRISSVLLFSLLASLLLLLPSLTFAAISPRLSAPLCSTSLYLPSAGLNVQLDSWGNDSIRIRMSPDTIQAIPYAQALLPYPPGLPPPHTLTSHSPCSSSAANDLTNGNLRVTIADDDTLTITRVSDGMVIVHDVDVSTSSANLQSVYPQPYPLYETSICYQHAQGQFYGLGEHKTGRTGYTAFQHSFENSQVYSQSNGGDISIPFYISTAGFGLLYNQAGYGTINITETRACWTSNATHQLDLWVTVAPMNGTSPTPYPALSSNYADATGHPNPLPHYASGFWQSKDRYRNQSEILGIAAHFHNLSVPVEVFVIDWQHWHFLGDWSFWLPQCWPNPTAMVQQLSSYGMHTMISAWPRVDRRSVHYANMSAMGYLTKDANGTETISADGTSFIYDAFNPAAREYVWDALLSGYVQHGIQLFWLDAAEPEQSVPGKQWWAGKSDREVGMAWSVHHQRMIFEGSLSSGIPEDQIIMLARHGWVGSPLMNAFIWSGDTESSWASFNVQVRMAPNVALSGIHWWATDIGGYFNGEYATEDFNMLLVRWFQWGAFLPIFRVHGHREPSEENEACGGGGQHNTPHSHYTHTPSPSPPCSYTLPSPVFSPSPLHPNLCSSPLPLPFLRWPQRAVDVQVL